jgi:hypothetical protein
MGGLMRLRSASDPPLHSDHRIILVPPLPRRSEGTGLRAESENDPTPDHDDIG